MSKLLLVPPIGIIKTMPSKMNRSDSYYWTFNLSGKPKYEVLYFYLLFRGAIRYRANIIGYDGSAAVKCYDGSIHKGKVWVNVGPPVIKLKTPIERKGFQGFRYTEEFYK